MIGLTQFWFKVILTSKNITLFLSHLVSICLKFNFIDLNQHLSLIMNLLLSAHFHEIVWSPF